MTYSIVARDESSGFFGVAVASRFFAVGAMVPFIKGRVGAVASQALVNPHYGPLALHELSAERNPAEVIEQLTAADNGAMNRQLHMIDHHGRNSAYTGAQCIDWAGHEVAENVSVAGNMLVGPQVVSDTLKTYQARSDKPFIERLLLAMQAGEDAGGDKRGRQSAALLVYHDQDYPRLDIRADDHADPLEELRRLYAVAQERYLIMADSLPSRENPHGLVDRSEIDKKIQMLDQKRRDAKLKSRSFASE